MALRNKNVEPAGHAQPRSRGNGVSNFLSGVAVLLSTLALLLGGFAAYQVFELRQTIQAVGNTASSPAIVPNPTVATQPSPEVNNSPNRPTQASDAPASPTTAAPAGGAEIQPGQFVQPAFGTKAQVELLSVKRIKDPDTANRDVVNVQMRVRRQAEDKVVKNDVITVNKATARNPETSETYAPVGGNRSTGSIALSSLRPNASADAYVWMRVPDGVNTIDLYIPDTQGFKNVPISN